MRSTPTLKPERLSAGASGSVLVIDFQPLSTGPRLGQLLADAGLDLTVHQLDPARELSGDGYLSLDELAEGYADAFLRADPAPVTTVLGYCSAAALALRIADRLATGRAVSTMLLRPTWPDANLIGSLLAGVRAELGSATLPAPDVGGDPRAALGGLERQLHAELRALADAHSLDPASRPLVELLERYRGWFGYLLAAQDGLRTRWPARPELNLQVYTDAADSAAVPWTEAGDYGCRLLDLPADEAAATGRLAQAVLEHLG